MLPNDPVMLLSYLNTQLRDFYPDLDACAEGLEFNKDEIIEKLSQIDYEYDPDRNQFV